MDVYVLDDMALGRMDHMASGAFLGFRGKTKSLAGSINGVYRKDSIFDSHIWTKLSNSN